MWRKPQINIRKKIRYVEFLSNEKNHPNIFYQTHVVCFEKPLALFPQEQRHAQLLVTWNVYTSCEMHIMEGEQQLDPLSPGHHLVLSLER